MIPSSGLQQLLHHSGTASLAPDAFDPWIYSLFASSSDAIIACDLNGIVCAWNQGAHHIFGIPSKQSLGKDLNQLLLSTTSLSKSSCSTAATLSSVAPVAPAASAALAPPPLSSSSAPSEPELYPCTLEQLRALKGASIKRIVSRNVKDRTQHTFLESISPVYHQQQQQATEASECDSGSHSHGTNGISSGNRNGTHVVPNGCDYSHNYSHFKTWIGTGTGTETTSPALAGYSVILTDLSTLPNSPVSAVYSPQLQSSSSSLSPPPRPPPPPVPLPPTPTSFSTLFSDATPETVPPTLPATTGPAIDSIVSTTVTAKDTSTMTASIAKYTTSVSTPSSAALSTTAVCLSPAAEEDKQEESSFRFPAISIRPTTSREYSTDSGFDERSIASKSSTTAASLSSMGVVSTPPLPPTSVTGERPKAVRIPVVQLSPLDPVPGPGPEVTPVDPFSEPALKPIVPSLRDLIPFSSIKKASVSMPVSRSNSISLPIDPEESSASVRPTTRSISLGHSLPHSLLNTEAFFRPRALSIATTAITYTSSGTQLSVSMSSSPDKSRLDIHHNSLAHSSDDRHSASLLNENVKQDRDWEDPYFSYLAPIAINLLTLHGDNFFDVVVEELAIHLGVKYAFISQLVSLEELKELDPTEYANLIDQFGGVVPPVDGVMHNISSWPGESHINPHAFQGYLADCTIQDKITFLSASLADKHQDVAECLMDHTIESYVGMRLETAQGEIMGVIGIIHDRPLTQEDGSIVKAVLGQIGARVANELDRLRIETNLIYARDVAESTAKNKTKFLADMSHEIRNPMNAVVGVTDILLDTAGLSDEQAGYIEVIRTSGQHLLTVINDILDISRIDQDVKFLLERRPLSLRKCLKDAVSLAGLTPLHDVSRSISVIEWPPEMDDLGPFTELEETNILPLLWSIDHDVPEHLLGDITRLRQVLINLCTNSLKFTRRGRVSVHVSIHNPTAQHPTIPPNCPSIVSRNSPHGSQAGDVSSLPSSPMLTGNDHRTQMVFQQRYDVNVKADGNNAGTAHAKVPTATTRRRPADKRHVALMAAGPPTSHDQSSSSSTPPSLTVVAPTANSLEGDKLDENTVILEFAVSDTGVGIPANKITELFTSFSQVDISVSTRFGGTGLGLAISAGLVEKMGGNIWVESTEGVGSRFTFTIPFTVCQSSETDSHPSVTAPSSPVSTHERYESANRGNLDTFTLPASINSTSGSTQEEAGKEKANENEKQKSRAQIPAPKEVAQPAGSPKSSMPTYAKMVESSLKPLTINGIPLRILLAEDNAVNQTIAVGVLKKLGYENVDVAQNGLEVIDKLDNGSVYDVILMDVSMPVMDGIDATKTIVERRRRGLLAAAESLAQTQTDKLDPDNKGASATLATPPTDTTAVSSIYKDYLNLYVIALTASAMGSDKERCMEAGMDDFMTKPFALLEMKRVLNGYVSNWNSGALRARNEACLSAALALRNQCHSPNCQSALSSLNSHSLTPTLGRSCSATSSNASLVDSGAGECAGCGQVLSTNDGNSTDGTSGILSASPTSPQSRTCRMETPRPLRRNLEGLGCGLFTAGRRSQSEILISGQTSGSALLGPMALETPSLPRRASDAFSFVKRDWRSGLGTNSEQSSGNGVHDVHPLDTSHSDQNPDPEHGHHSNSAFQPSHLRVKRVMSPSNLSKEYDTSDCKPMASPLSPLSLLTTDTEGSSSVSPPLSSSSTSSLTETQARSDEMLLGSGRFSLDSSDAASTKDADSTSKVDMAHETQPSLAVA